MEEIQEGASGSGNVVSHDHRTIAAQVFTGGIEHSPRVAVPSPTAASAGGIPALGQEIKAQAVVEVAYPLPGAAEPVLKS